MKYYVTQEAILLDLLRVISHHRARLATPIRTVQKIYSDADLENIPFADGIYSGPRGSANRPLLLIEPSYKVSGEDKTKSPSRKPIEEKDGAKVETTSASTDLKEAKKDDKSSKLTNAAASDKKDQNLGKPESPQAPKDKKTDALKEDGSSSDKDGDRTVVSSSPSNTSRAPLEENIVLGVALEGSKRTLPIEEEEKLPSETKELTAQRNGSGSSLGNDGQVSSGS